jgi:UDP-N-acetylmuramoyl-L-alanyl-D-glutamate--2,6-diaminopimelate ligase
VGITLGDFQYPSQFTTPESIDLQNILAVAKEMKVRSIAMEVSSHALAQFRVRGVKFEFAGFSNLTQDHLDFHGDMESYFLAKAKLFTSEYSEKSFINIDDPYGRRLIELAENEIHTLSRFNTSAQWHYVRAEQSPRGFDIAIRGEGGILIESNFNMIGDHNLDNLLMAVAITVTSGVDPLLISQVIPQLQAVPGRLEKIEEGQDFFAVVDYAHTPDAVERTLASLRKNTLGKIIAVLGCGGDRDPGKRPLMGAALVQGSDIPVFTSDNPRSEDAQLIIDEMKTGLSIPSHALTYVSRAEAIAAAVKHATAGDAVVILGKGHESGQIIGSEVFPFDDRHELRKAILSSRGLHTP